MFYFYMFLVLMNVFVGVVTWVTGEDQSLFAQVGNSFIVASLFLILALQDGGN